MNRSLPLSTKFPLIFYNFPLYCELFWSAKHGFHTILMKTDVTMKF